MFVYAIVKTVKNKKEKKEKATKVSIEISFGGRVVYSANTGFTNHLTQALEEFEAENKHKLSGGQSFQYTYNGKLVDKDQSPRDLQMDVQQDNIILAFSTSPLKA